VPLLNVTKAVFVRGVRSTGFKVNATSKSVQFCDLNVTTTSTGVPSSVRFDVLILRTLLPLTLTIAALVTYVRSCPSLSAAVIAGFAPHVTLLASAGLTLAIGISTESILCSRIVVSVNVVGASALASALATVTVKAAGNVALIV